MAIKLPNLKIFTGADAKSRVFMVFAALAAVGLVVYIIISYFGSSETGSGSNVAAAPSSLQTVPGSQLTPEYSRAVVEASEQAARQAQMSGGSAVPILMNVPGQQQGFGASTDCTILCPNDDNVNVADDINNLVRQGKLSQEDGNRLLALARNNVSVDEYAAALDDLVRQGKLTPEQARQLLEKYKKQHANAIVNESAKVMDNMIKAGQLPLDVANQLLALQKKNLTPDEYAAELNRLVREGKLTPEAAARLLAQYTQQKMQEQAKKGAFALQQMARAGQITPDVAKGLQALQDRGASVDEYAAELNRLVAAGKMTPEAAAKLLEQYKKQRAGLGAAGAVNALVDQQQAKTDAALNDLVKSGKISPEAAKILAAMQQKGLSPEAYQAALGQLVQSGKLSPEAAAAIRAIPREKMTPEAYEAAIAQLVKSGKISPEAASAVLALRQGDTTPEAYEAMLSQLVKAGKLSPEDAKKLAANYRQLVAMRAQAQRLAALQGNNASPAQYAEELKRAVQAGLISPQTAASLYSQYRAMLAPVVPGAGQAPGVETNIPGGAAFAQLQQQLQQQTPGAPTEDVQFTPAQPQAAQGETDEQRRQRLEQLQAAMSNQAQSLLAAWQPPVMEHKEGTQEKDKEKEKQGASGSSASGTKTADGGKGELPPSGPALIKAGTILFAVLDTAVNSDYPDTPIMATIVQGPLKGAKLLGKLSLAEGQDRVSLNFNMMDKEDWEASKSVSAFAIDPDTARTVMASSVDYHYMKRYGAMMATSFLSGYSSAVTNAGNVTTGIFGTSTTHPQLSPGNKIAVGLGQIGTNLTSQIQSYINTPTTVKVNSGVGLGILFMSEVR
jgi:type IV secretory pathway VirB10-like protein